MLPACRTRNCIERRFIVTDSIHFERQMTESRQTVLPSSKGQLISKANCQAVNFSKKHTKKHPIRGLPVLQIKF